MPAEYQMMDNRASRFWQDPTLYGLSLLCLFLDEFGTEGLTWEPETIEMEVHSEFGVDLPAASFDRLMTAISILTSNSFFVSPPDFTRACVSLSGHAFNPESFILPDCADLAWGITEGLLISPPDDKQEAPFSREIIAYVGACLDDEGIITAPDVLRIGLRDRDVADQVRYNFSDDPEMFSAVQGMEADKTDAINQLVQGRLRGLLTQLRELPVADGRAAQLAAKLLSKLPGDEALPLPG